MERAEAIKIIKTATVYTPEEMEALETLIPELKESEDEKVRKFLLKLANQCREDSTDFLGDVKKADVIAYLEKQKEHLRDAVAWLKSLRPSWKPSEKELEALERCVDYLDESDNEDHGIIQALYEQLKQL